MFILLMTYLLEIKKHSKKAKFTKSNNSNYKISFITFKKNNFDILIHFAAFIDVEEVCKKAKKIFK